jgi:hypothetical protein
LSLIFKLICIVFKLMNLVFNLMHLWFKLIHWILKFMNLIQVNDMILVLTYVHRIHSLFILCLRRLSFYFYGELLSNIMINENWGKHAAERKKSTTKQSIIIDISASNEKFLRWEEIINLSFSIISLFSTSIFLYWYLLNFIVLFNFLFL